MRKTDIKNYDPLHTIYRTIKIVMKDIERDQKRCKEWLKYLSGESDFSTATDGRIQAVYYKKKSEIANKLKPYYFTLSKINKRTKTFNVTYKEDDLEYIKKFVDREFPHILNGGDNLIMCLTKPKEEWGTIQ